MTTGTLPTKIAHRQERLRPDWPVRVFAYDVTPVGQIPDEVWRTAKLMQQLWNECVELFSGSEKERPRGSKETPLTDEQKAIRVAHDKAFRLRLRDHVKTYKGVLGSTYYYFVRDRFMDSVNRYHSGKGGIPRKRFGLKRIILPWKTQDGGRPIEFVHASPNNRVYLRRVPIDAYMSTSRQACRERGTRGHWQIGDSVVPFMVNLHRPLPEGAFFKGGALAGRLERPFGWRWRLTLTVEYPPLDLPKTPTGKTAAIDLGWRVREDGIRVGTLVDNRGRAVEFVLPFAQPTHSTRRLRERFGSRTLVVEDWRDLDSLRERADNELEACKTAIKPYLEDYKASEWCDSIMHKRLVAFHMVRNRGLLHLLAVMPEGTPGRGRLMEWRDTDRAYHGAMRAGALRLEARRNWLYHNIAVQLAKEYDELIWEGDLSLKDMAETETDKIAIKASQRYRQMASLFTLRKAIMDAFAKAGKVLTKEKAAYSTRVCARCGAPVAPGAKLVLTCENGHAEDQDVNAAMILLARQDVFIPAFRPSAGTLLQTDQLRNIVRALDGS